ncbi:glycine-rich RNA-binding protein RZ1B isoform X1 [Iris pallida]|uniref:Glycine-rich RNA-binding protein RZ1B isoform X1 n=1 Tax=Iris pallida TaxID=29817 RepID=A0AAX6FJU0_IRIPA|nr:glycine-rich RNA-binding protein RZ1B isoform X1 [Iris pallida]
MTIDDENSIYVGGLPYDATEEELRRVFDLFGSVVAVKIVNDRDVGRKCYGFVTFTNPRSAVHAISDMHGRTIRGRVVIVNEVRTRAGRPNFHRENFRRDTGRDVEWDGDRDRDHVRDRDRYRDRSIERSHDRDRERERDYEFGRDFDRSRDDAFDRGRDRSDHDQEHSRDHDRDWDGDHDMDWGQDREVDKLKDHDADRDKDKKQQSRNRIGGARVDHRRSRELSNSSDEYHQQVRDELDLSIQRHEELQQELLLIEGNLEQKRNLVSDLEKKSKKLEDSLITSKKLTSQRQSLLTKLHKCFLQAQDCTERLKSSEQDLKALTEAAEIDVDEEDGIREI